MLARRRSSFLDWLEHDSMHGELDLTRAHPPEFVIAGFPKCGTTSIYVALSQHPQVCMSRPFKEPNFWDQARQRRDVSDIGAYCNLWSRAGPDQLRGEASAQYALSESALPALLRWRPNVRVVLMLRNPLAMLPSYYAQQRWNLREPEPDFAKAWRREVGEPNYRKLGMLGRHMLRAMKTVPRNQLHVILFDDLLLSPDFVWLELQLFLGLNDDGRRELPQLNRRRERLWRPLASWLRSIPAPVRLHPTTRPIRRLWQRVSARPLPDTALPSSLRAEMSAHFAADVALLGRLIGQDLNYWLDP